MSDAHRKTGNRSTPWHAWHHGVGPSSVAEQEFFVLPWEQTEGFIHSGHNDSDVCQPGTLRTITISDDEGIKAVICRPRGKDSTIVQSYLFAKAKGWTLAKAKEWFSKHETASAGVAIPYYIRAQAVEQDGKKYALIEVIDEGVSRPCESPPETRVRINPAGKARALAGLLDQPLRGPPELGHDATAVVGHPVDFMSNHATRVLYEIVDPVAWAKIRSGEWGPVSPRMTPLTAHYEDDVFVLDEWLWDDVAFVPVGAFPNAGVKSTCIGDPRLYGFSYAVAAAAADFSKSRLKAGRPRTETDVAGYSHNRQPDRERTEGPPGGVTMEKDKESEKVIAELTDAKTKLEAELADIKGKHETELKDLEVKAEELTKAKAKVDGELKELKAKAAPPVAASEATVALQAELKAVKAECDALKAWKAAAEDADHMRRVQEVVDLQVGTGAVEPSKVQAAVEEAKKLPNDSLDALKKTLGTVKAKFDSLPSGPKARLIPSVAGARFDPMQPTVGDLVGKKPGDK